MNKRLSTQPHEGARTGLSFLRVVSCDFVERFRLASQSQKFRCSARHSPHLSLKIICALLFILLSATTSMATSLETYREQVHVAVSTLDVLPQWKKVESQAAHTRRLAATVEQLRASVLTIETIEWNGKTIKVDNKWLAEALARYEQLPADDEAQRAAQLAQVKERLQALDERLTELGGEANGASKVEEKQKLDSILRRAEYSDKTDEGSALSRLWERFRRWVRGLFPNRNPLAPGTASALSGISQIIVIGLALAVIGFILWKFTPMFRRGGGGRSREKREARVVLGERLEPDQTSADLLAEAERLARAGELRAAIRKGYIALLCELGDRKIIGLAEHKTNSDYLGDVRQIEPLHRQMQQLTRSFESHWYGLIPATENDWHAFRSGFQKAVTSDK